MRRAMTRHGAAACKRCKTFGSKLFTPAVTQICNGSAGKQFFTIAKKKKDRETEALGRAGA